LERRRRARTSDVLALGLGEQSIVFAGLARQPGRVRFCVVPIHVDDGVLAPTPSLIAGLVSIASAVADARVPLVERHGIFACREWRRDRHPHLLLPIDSLRLVRGRSHGECAGWHHHHLWARPTVLEALPELEATLLVADERLDTVAPAGLLFRHNNVDS